MFNPYEILKVSADAPPEVIRAAYKVLSSKYHPDKHPGSSGFTKVMQDINKAYYILSNPVERKKYDDQVQAENDVRNEEKTSPSNENVVIYCLHCKCAIHASLDDLKPPKRFFMVCPECQENPLSKTSKNTKGSSTSKTQESRKIIIKCKHCGQSIRVLLRAIHEPDRYDVNCPVCKMNPISTPEEYGYVQSPDPGKQEPESFFNKISNELINELANAPAGYARWFRVGVFLAAALLLLIMGIYLPLGDWRWLLFLASGGLGFVAAIISIRILLVIAIGVIVTEIENAPASYARWLGIGVLLAAALLLLIMGAYLPLGDWRGLLFFASGALGFVAAIISIRILFVIATGIIVGIVLVFTLITLLSSMAETFGRLLGIP